MVDANPPSTDYAIKYEVYLKVSLVNTMVKRNVSYL